MQRLNYWLLRAKLAALSLLNPWRAVRQLREENARLVATITDPLLTGINIGNGTLDVGMEGPGPQLVDAMREDADRRYQFALALSNIKSPLTDNDEGRTVVRLRAGAAEIERLRAAMTEALPFTVTLGQKILMEALDA